MKNLIQNTQQRLESKEAMERISEQNENGDESVESSNDSTSKEGAQGKGSSSGQKVGETSTSSFDLASGETRMILYSKFGLLLLIAVVTCAVAVATYKIVRKQEKDAFHEEVSLSLVTKQRIFRFGREIFL